MPKFIWELISFMMFDIQAQRKNFYKGISKVGFKEYMRLKKIIPAELKENKDFKYNVSIVAIAKNESVYFKEWIEYHKLIGVEHFYIYNNESTDNTKEILEPYIQAGLVTLTDFPGVEQQGPAYNDAIAKYKDETRWLCPLDLDEFICLKKHNNLKEFLEGFKDCFQVSLRWMYYGSSGHIEEPKGLVIENFTKHAKECSSSPKSIFNPRAAIDAALIHYAIGVGKWVDENHKLYSEKNPTSDIAQINHYYIKSKEEFIHRKTARGSTNISETIRNVEETFAKFDFNDVDDGIMQKYVKILYSDENSPLIKKDKSMKDMKNLKIAHIQGGLGNQMFIYAFAQNYPDMLYDKTDYNDKNYHRAFDLGLYNIDRKFATDEQIKICKHDFRIKNRLFSKKWRKFFHLGTYILDFSNIKTEKAPNLYQKNLLGIKGPAYFEGYFQTDKYFNAHRQKLLHDFTLLEKLDDVNAAMLQKITKENAVAVHIRRGDYTTPRCPLELLDLDYYTKAFEIIKEKVENPHFFIFSNDPQWVQENINTGCKQTIVDINDESHGYLDLELMKHCKHHIIANSSFSWWGAWLSENPNKVVIAPFKWFKPNRGESTADAIPESWIRI